MTRTILLEMALLSVFAAGSAFAQEAPNTARRIEISYTGNLRYFLGFGFVRKGGSNLGGACVQVAVTVTDSAALIGELCGTHQFLALPRSAQSDDGRHNRWPLSEAGQQVDSLLSVRGGMRLSGRIDSRTTTFVQALAGVETGYRHGGFADNSGFSFAAGGGVDISLTSWLAYEMARANYQTTRVGGTTVNSLRFGTGPVFRMGATADQSTASPSLESSTHRTEIGRSAAPIPSAATRAPARATKCDERMRVLCTATSAAGASAPSAAP